MTAEAALIDTNVLVYALFAGRPEHAASLALLESAQDSGANLVLAPQNLAEFYAVVTNPRRVSTPLSASDARAEVEKLTRLPGLRVLDVPADVVMRWHALLGRYPVTVARSIPLPPGCTGRRLSLLAAACLTHVFRSSAQTDENGMHVREGGDDFLQPGEGLGIVTNGADALTGRGIDGSGSGE